MGRLREITREKLNILRKADAVYLDEIDSIGLCDQIWQAFAVLLSVKTVGIMGDGRIYDYVCALRANYPTDNITVDFHSCEPAFLGRVAMRIINEVHDTNRVACDYMLKATGMIEWERGI